MGKKGKRKAKEAWAGRALLHEQAELRLEVTSLRVLAQHRGPEKSSVSLLRVTAKKPKEGQTD